MKQGCIIVNPELIADPAIFEALLQELELIRQLEVNSDTHVLIVQHDGFKEVPIGGSLYFYDIEFRKAKTSGEIYLSSIGEAFYHPTLNFTCQKKQEPPKEETNQETEIWPGLM